MKFLYIILAFIAVYILIRIVFKLYGKSIIQWLSLKALQRVQKNFEKLYNYDADYSQNNTHNTTKSRVENKSEKKKVGEYVDFEEID